MMSLKKMLEKFSIHKISRFFHTIKYLKQKQLIYLVLNRLKLKRKAKLVAVEFTKWEKVWSSPQWRGKGWLGCHSYSFAGTSHDIKSYADWNNSKFDKLWLYNLHYLDDLRCK